MTFYFNDFTLIYILSEILIKHVYKNLFLPIIQYSDVGIDPEAETEMEIIQPFGRQAIEEEIESMNTNEQDDDTALKVCFISLFYNSNLLFSTLV